LCIIFVFILKIKHIHKKLEKQKYNNQEVRIMKSKKILAGVLTCTLIGGVIPYCRINSDFSTNAVTSEETNVKTDGIFVYETVDDHIIITEIITPDDGIIDIPNEIDGLPVTYVHWSCNSLSVTGKTNVSLTIPENVEYFNFNLLQLSISVKQLETVSITVDENNKAYCSENGFVFSKDKTKLIVYPASDKSETYVIPDTVKSISEGAFARCENLKSVIIPESVEFIGSNAFRGCKNLTEITIPGNIKNIVSGTFAQCENLKKVTFEEGLKTLSDAQGQGIFEDCTSLTEINLPESLIFIGSSAFTGCTELADITIPDNVNYVGANAFSETAWFKNQPDGMIYINNIAYRYKGNTPDKSEFTFEDGTEFISDGAFKYVSGIKSIVVPESVTEISGKEFIYCNDLQSITILNPECSIDKYIYTDNHNIFPDIDDTSIYHGKIQGYDGSTAQTYAIEHENEFISLGEAPEVIKSTVKGDLTLDGKVDISDVVAAAAYVADPEINSLKSQGIINGDVHGDENGIDSNDVLAIQQYLAGIIKEL